MKCPSCGVEMEKVVASCCESGCCEVDEKPYWLCPNCGRVEQIK